MRGHPNKSSCGEEHTQVLNILTVGAKRDHLILNLTFFLIIIDTKPLFIGLF